MNILKEAFLLLTQLKFTRAIAINAHSTLVNVNENPKRKFFVGFLSI